MTTQCTDASLLELTNLFSAMSLSSVVAPLLPSNQRLEGSKSVQNLPTELLLEIYKVCPFSKPLLPIPDYAAGCKTC